MKTLVIASQLPLPEIGGDRIRTMNFVRYFSRYGDVDIAYYNHCDGQDKTDHTFGNVFHIEIGEEKNRTGKISELYEKIKYSKPWTVCNYTKEAIGKMLEVIETGKYDHIVCRYAVNAYPLFFLSSAIKNRVIVDIDDVMSSELYGSVHGKLSGIGKVKSLINMKLSQLYQVKCAKIGKTLICSEQDRKNLIKSTRSPHIYVVPNIAPSFSPPQNYMKNGHAFLGNLLFVGNLGYKPNAEGLLWFIEEIFLKLIRERPDVKLRIVGKQPGKELRSLCRQHRQLELVENPPHISVHYSECGVSVVPLLIGGGTRIKILEAGRALRPVISTEIGAFGLDVTDYKDVLIIKDYPSFMERYLWLENEGNYKTIADQMNAYVENNYSENNFSDAMKAVLAGAGRGTCL